MHIGTFSNVGVALILAAPFSVWAGETRLPFDPALWQHAVIDGEGILQARIADFALSPDSLAIGPWIAGKTGALYECLSPLPARSGTVRGRYRTEHMLPKQARVRVGYNQNGHRLTSLDFPLAAAEKWSDFAIPLFAPPAGVDSLTLGVGLGEMTNGKVYFSDLRFDDHYDPPQYSGGEPALTRAAPPRGLAPSAYVRLECNGDTWWLVSPAGKAFFSTGSAMPFPSIAGTGPERLLFAHMQDLGFNSVAGNHDSLRWAAFNAEQMAAGRPNALQFLIVESGPGNDYDTLVDATGANPGPSQAMALQGGGFNHAFPDPYDPRWEKSLREQVRTTARQVRGQPYFAGWFAGNERRHKDIHRYVWSKACAEAFGRFLQGKYTEIGPLNAAWGTQFPSFANLLAQKPDPVVRRGAMYNDFRLFTREIIRRYNEIVLRTIHEEDPGRLVFSNRFMLGEVQDVLDNLDLYADFDALAVNLYPSDIASGIDTGERQYLNEIHRKTGKAILITEWSVPALDSGLYGRLGHIDWSYPQTVPNQQVRARQAAQTEADYYNLPFVIGAHWFTWNDLDSSIRQANRGLFKADGEPWTELDEALRRLNQRFP